MHNHAYMNQQVSQQLGADALFNQYIDIVNRAIGQNKDGIYGEAVDLWDKTMGGKHIAVGVYKGDADSPHHWYTVKLDNGSFDLIDASKRRDAAYSWKISDQHLANVVDDPDKYVESPVKLDLDWIKTRAGLA